MKELFENTLKIVQRVFVIIHWYFLICFGVMAFLSVAFTVLLVLFMVTMIFLSIAGVIWPYLHEVGETLVNLEAPELPDWLVDIFAYCILIPGGVAFFVFIIFGANPPNWLED